MPLTERRLVGEVFAGNFKIEAQLGRGAMGEVYLAEQISLGKKVAIKVLHRHLQGDEGLAKRFHREAKAASSLNHPNSLQVIDFGQSSEGELFIAMELVSGRDLAQLMNELEPPLPTDRIVRVISQVLAALDEAHALGIIHRDLKPENVMIVDRRGERDFVKVCDFGIAKIQDPKSDSDGGTITMAGMVCGTPEYMSPEQCRGEKLDGRSDLYSVGVILYQMTTGELPFTAESALGIVTKHLTETPIAPRKRRPEVALDPRLETIIMRSLSKHREGRFASAQAMRDALESLLRPRSSDALPETQTFGAAGDPYASDDAMAMETKTHRWKWAAAACLPLLVVAVVLVVRGKHMAPATDARTAEAGTGVASQGGHQGGHQGGQKTTGAKLADGKDKAAPGRSGQLGPGPGTPGIDDAPAGTEVKPQPAQAAGEKVSPTPAPERAAQKTPEKRRTAGRRSPTSAPAAIPTATSAPMAAASGTPPASEPVSPAAAAFRDGKRLLDQGSVREAIGKFLEAVRHDPNHAPSYKALGQAHMRLGQTDEGKRYYRRYLEFKPDDLFVRAIVER